MVADKEENENEGIVAEGGAPVEGEDAKGFGKKQILLFIVLPLIILIGVGAGLYFGGFIGGGHKEEVAEDAAAETKQSTGIFYDLPDIIVNLNTAGRKARFLKISASMELQQQTDVAAVEKILPRVLDHFQTYLRELREEDLRGSSGIYRLRFELLARVNAAASPVQVNDILFREILVQ